MPHPRGFPVILGAAALLLGCCESESSKRECSTCPQPICPQQRPKCPQPECPQPECPQPACPQTVCTPGSQPVSPLGGDLPPARESALDKKFQGLTPEQTEKECKKLFEEAYLIKNTDKTEATKKLEAILRVLPESNPYHTRAKKLIESIQGHAVATREAMDFYKLGAKLFSENDYSNAIVEFRKVIALDPSFCAAYTSLGSALVKIGMADQAAKAYEEFLRRCPNSMNADAVRRLLKEYNDAKAKSP